MVELRWVMSAHTTTEAPRLQYRQCGEWPAAWGPWVDVPAVVEQDAPKPATNLQAAFPNRFQSTDGHNPILQLAGDCCPCERCEADRRIHGLSEVVHPTVPLPSQAAIDSPSFDMPPGLTPEEKRALILGVAAASELVHEVKPPHPRGGEPQGRGDDGVIVGAPAEGWEPRETLAEQGCNCRWKGGVVAQRCELHEAWHTAIHEWAQRAKTAEGKLAAMPLAPDLPESSHQVNPPQGRGGE